MFGYCPGELLFYMLDSKNFVSMRMNMDVVVSIQKADAYI
jgi:hypothetical protein